MNASREQGLLLEKLRSKENDGAFEDLARRALAERKANIDFVYPHPVDKTLLEVACRDGRVDVAEILLKLGANANRINEEHNRGPIHFAAEAGHPEILAILLKDGRSNPNLEAAGRQTALHLAVRNRQPECVKVLLENGANPNIANAKGLTAIRIAARNDQREIVRLILKSSKFPPNIDDFRDFGNRTTRQVLRLEMPDLELPPSTAEGKIDGENLARACPSCPTDGSCSEIEFLENLRKLEDSRFDVRVQEELMRIAVKRNFSRAIGELMTRARTRGLVSGGSSIISKAANFAAELGRHRVLKEILMFDEKLEANQLLLTACRELGVPRSLEEGHEDDRIECLRLILERADVDARCQDDKGNTPLHYAARAESSEAVGMLLRSGSYIGHRNVLGVPPLAHISPGVLSNFFDDCLRGENERTDEYEIEFDYRCLMPRGLEDENDDENDDDESNATSSEMEALGFVASKRSLKPLLKHPLLSSFLYLKWHRIRYVLYANFIFYVLFYALINLYILSTTINDATNSSERPSSNHTSARVPTSSQQRRLLRESLSLKSLSAIALLLQAIRESLWLVSSPRRYVSSLENLLQLALIVLGACTVVSANPQIGAVVILLSAWRLVILIGQHPRMSTAIQMFKTVSINFIRFLFLYAFLILAFALAFFTLFNDSKDDENFPDPGHSLFKTIIMLTGEFDANDIPFVAHPVLGRCIFVLFVFLIAIVLFNLLNGLAVSDTADILNKSELVGLVSRTKLISYAERMALGGSALVRFNRHRCFERSLRRFKLNPLGFLLKRILLFPRYLPQGKLGVKPFKSNEIRLYGRSTKTRSCANCSMDPSIVARAREILNRRGEITENERIFAKLDTINRKLERLENLTNQMRLELENNKS